MGKTLQVNSSKVKGYALVAAGIALFFAGHYSNPKASHDPARLARRLSQECDDETGATEKGICEEVKNIEATKDEEKGMPGFGKFLLHLCGLFYMFIALYLVCDEFFVPSLDALSNALGLSPDVAGATFMAAGGSAPEFFTSLFSVFSETSSETGIAAIVGSAVFNVLAVIGACGIAAPGTLKLTAYPLTRDCAFYLVDLIVLWIFFSDGTIQFYEGLILFLLYVAYCVFMKFSGQIEEKFAQYFDKKEAQKEFELLDKDKSGVITMDEMADVARFKRLDRNNDGVLTLQELEWELRSMRNYAKQQENADEDADNQPLTLCPPGYVDDDDDEDVIDDEPPPTIKAYLWYILTFPLVLCLVLTVPDVRRGGCWAKLYVPGFFMSIIWIAIFSKFMVDFSETVGAFTTISTVILAVTLLAWGTSIPDLLTSVLVTLQGHGDMAVSSSIGSNIFDVTVGLPVPWMISCLVKGKAVEVAADGINIWILLLLGMVLVTIAGIVLNGWVLNKKLGTGYIILFILFMVYMVWSVMD